MRTARWLLTFALVTAFCAAHAQTGKWPEKPVRIIIASAPGGGDDLVTRLIAPKLDELLGQQFIAENRAGVGGMIGQTFVQKSPPDGYRNFVGQMMVRHMCAVGLPSKPRPSFGCLKLRPTTSVNSSRLTRTAGSKA
jgi:tripartite-type tricarboxylate transporter receptor subunit TctC